MILNEGGNVFADATPFDHKDVPEILKVINTALQGTGIRAIPVGSAATPKPGKKSGDMDVIVDEPAVLNFFKAKDAKTARKALNDYINKQGLETAQSGINVHVRVPVGDEAHQVDIMVTANAERVSKFHTHDIPEKSPYKGVNKQLMLAILAKSKGYMWSAWQGLFSRNPEGKKGEFITDDLDEIATILLGPSTSSKNLGSVEAILGSLPGDEANMILDKARQDPNWKEKQNENIARLKTLAGLQEATQAPADLSNFKPKTEVPSIPELPAVELKPGVNDLGNGQRIELKQDGTKVHSSGLGSFTYDKTGKAIKYTTPSFSGLAQDHDLVTGNITVRYASGPMSVVAQYDKNGKQIGNSAEYDLGLGKMGFGQEKGITTKTWTPASDAEGEDPITQKDMYAKGNKDKEATYDRAMKQVNQQPKESAELEAMLRIARLR